MEHVKIHSTSSLGTSAFDQCDENEDEETRTVKKDFNQHMERPPNVTVMAHTSDRPARQRYDFIPSKYQPLVHTNPMYGEMAVGNWALPHNFYLPLRPKDHGVPRRQDEPVPISPRHQPISPRRQPISPRHNPISPQTFAEVSANDTVSFRSNVDSYRSTEPPENPESHRRSTELSEHHRPSTESSYMNPMSSENGSNELRVSTTANTAKEYPQTSPNAIADPNCTTSFAAYRAIALSRVFHRSNSRQREQETSQNQSPSNPYEHTTGRHEPTTGRDDPTYSRHDSTTRKQTSVANVEASHRPDVATGAGEVYPVNNFPDSHVVNPSYVRNNSDSLGIHRNPHESRKYSDDVRLQTEVIRRSSNLEENTQRNSDGVEITSERIRSNSESIGDQNYLISLTRSRENSTTSENDTADGRLSNRPSSHRKNSESHLAKSVKRKYTCLNCRSEFYHESTLVDHVCDIFSETMYSCLVCKEDFENYEDLQQHMRTHWKQVTYFKCTLCGERLRSEKLVKEHNLKHLEVARAERSESLGSEGDKDAYHRKANDKT